MISAWDHRDRDKGPRGVDREQWGYDCKGGQREQRSWWATNYRRGHTTAAWGRTRTYRPLL